MKFVNGLVVNKANVLVNLPIYGHNRKSLLQRVNIDNDVETAATEKTVEEREQEIVARYTAQSEIVESEGAEEPEEADPVPYHRMPTWEILLNQLRIGLETKGFPWKSLILLLHKFVIFCKKWSCSV